MKIQTVNEALITFSARDAKARFGEVLDEALGRPVGITRHERLTAYVVSKRDFESLRDRVQELEDKLWLLQAEIARTCRRIQKLRKSALLAKDLQEVRTHKARKRSA